MAAIPPASRRALVVRRGGEGRSPVAASDRSCRSSETNRLALEVITGLLRSATEGRTITLTTVSIAH
jgi:hypothetical protein